MKRKLGLAFAGTMVAILLSAIFQPYWLALEGSFIDWRFKLKEPSKFSEKIKVFEIYGNLFSSYGLIIKELIKQDAKTISIFIPENDFKENLDWLKEFPKSKLVVSVGGRIIERLDESIHDSDSLGKANGIVEVSSLVNFLSLGKKNTLANFSVFEKEVFSHSSAYKDSFGKLRKIPLWLESGQQLIPAFALRSWFHYLKVKDPEIKILSSRMKLKDKSVEISIPTDMNNMTMVEMPKAFEENIVQLKGNSESVVETISNADVKDKLVFVGFFTSDKELKDKNPFRFQIALANSFLKESFLKEAHKSTVHSLSLALSILAVMFFGLGRGMKKYLGIVFLTSFYLIINLMLFNSSLILPILSPILAMTFSILADRSLSPEEVI
jgi:hypothetical protein